MQTINRHLRTLAVTIVMLLILPGLLQGSAVLAQGFAVRAQVPDSPNPRLLSVGIEQTQPEIPIQGRLTDSAGTPVTGMRMLTLSLYTEETATQPQCMVNQSVLVVNGLFNTLIGACSSAQIYGEKLWLGIKVEGDAAEMLPRQPIQAVPYAVSLVPGASIRQFSVDEPALYLASTMNADVLNLRSGNGTFLSAQDLVGTDTRFSVKNGGEVWSKADTKIVISPLDMIADAPTLVKLGPINTGNMVATALGSTFPSTLLLYVPVNVPSVLLGSPMKLKSARVCYFLNNADTRVDVIGVRESSENGSWIDQGVTLSPPSTPLYKWHCVDISGGSTAITGPLMVAYTVTFPIINARIYFGNITLTLTEQ